jgi:hypothetical protein
MDLFLYQLRHSDSDGNAQSLFVYTRHVVTVFGVPGAYYPGLEMSKRIGRSTQRDLEEYRLEFSSIISQTFPLCLRPQHIFIMP